MVYDDVATVSLVKLTFDNYPIPCCIDRSPDGSGEVHARVKLRRLVYRAVSYTHLPESNTIDGREGSVRDGVYAGERVLAWEVSAVDPGTFES